MPRTPAIRDPKHPDYPHGEPRGWENGCKQKCCRRAMRAKYHRYERAKRAGVLHPGSSVSAEPVKAHVAKLRSEVPYLTDAAIARCCGLSRPSVTDAIRPSRATVRLSTRKAILAVTVSQAAAAVGAVRRDRYVFLARTMQAAGWGITWQRTRIGNSYEFLYDESKWLSKRVAARIEALAKEVGDRIATPENSGQGKHAITYAKTNAAKFGYYPPACYDDAGNLIPEAVPGRVSTVDARAEKMLRIIETYLECGTEAATAERAGVDGQEVTRAVKRAGLNPTLPFRTLRANRERARQVLDATERDGMNPVHAALTLGVLTQVHRDHPGRVAYEVDRAELLADWLAAKDAHQAATTREHVGIAA